jgi:SHS family sialic acid transporter-like MFS transporter
MADTEPQAAEKEARTKLTAAMWIGLIAAFLGWMFDGFEMGLYGIVTRPALAELLGTDDESRLGLITSVTIAMFLTGMAAGGLAFGRLGDRIGRVKSMALAILMYAVFTGLSGFTRNWQQLAACRFLGAMGLGGEWGLGVALVMESWPNASRPLLAGLLGAAANFGFLASAGVGWLKAYYAWGWREPLWCGAVPALLVFLLRLGVKEPEKFVRSRERGETSRLRELFSPEFRRRTLVGSGLGAVAVLGMWGSYQMWLPMWAPRLAVPDMERVTAATQAAKAAAAAANRGEALADRQVRSARDAVEAALVAADQAAARNGAAAAKAAAARGALDEAGETLGPEEPGGTPQRLKEAAAGVVAAAQTVGDAIRPVTSAATAATMQWMSIGSIVGALLGALIGDWLGRRRSYALLCVASLAAALLLYLTSHDFGPRFLLFGCLAGLPITAFFGWLPLYLPELYPTRLRATGEGFCFNVGRVISAGGVFGTGALCQALGAIPLAAATMSVIFLFGLPLIALAPETKGQELPE